VHAPRRSANSVNSKCSAHECVVATTCGQNTAVATRAAECAAVQEHASTRNMAGHARKDQASRANNASPGDEISDGRERASDPRSHRRGRWWYSTPATQACTTWDVPAPSGVGKVARSTTGGQTPVSFGVDHVQSKLQSSRRNY
jgi:hypothetical protein